MDGNLMFKRKHFGPLSFWCLNHQLEKPELARQLDELKARGFTGFFMHPRAGLLTPYGSTAWFDAIGFCIQHAKRIGLEAWLYDEDPYPSGMAGGRVTMDHPELRASFLQPTVLPVKRPGRYGLDLPQGPLVGAFLVRDGKIIRVDQHAGLVRTDWVCIRLASHSYYPPFSAEGSPHWRADANHPHYRLSIEIQNAPATLIAFTRHYARHEPWGEYADLLNPKAVASFIELTHKDYHRRFRKEFGKTIPGIFTDEPKAVGVFPWSETLNAIFRSITGQSLVDCLPHLLLDIDDRTIDRRWAYREAISRAFKTAYIDPVENFCRKVGLASTGHISPEEDPLGQAIMTPGLMNWIGGMTIPGVDLIGAEIGDARHKLFHLGPKIASSAAHTRGKQDVLCEAFAVMDWVQDTSWMGKAINWLYVLGVNMLTTHGQFYSIDGPRKREAPPSQFIQASYWEHFSALSQYVENLSRELTVGRHAAPVALYYPSEAFMALASASGHPPKASQPLRDRLAELMDQLLTSGFDFDLVDAQALCAAKMGDGKMKIQGESYSVLVMPGGWLREDAALAARKLERRGLPIFAMQRPMPILGGGGYRARRATKPATLLRDLAAHCRPIYKAGGRLLGHQRVAADGARLFLVNNADTKFHGKVAPDFDGPYEVLDLQTGRALAVKGPLQLEIEPARGVLIRQRGKAARSVVHRNASDWQPWLDLSTGWTARAESDNCLVLNEFRMRAAAAPRAVTEDEFISAPFVDLLAPEARLSARHLGRVTYFWTSFECRGYDRSLALVRDSQLGPPADRERSDNYRFFVNGRKAPPFLRHRRYDPYNLQTSIKGLIREGRNFLVMEQTLPADWPLEKGMPYDGVRLFGDFHVEMPFGRTMPALLTPRPAAYEMGVPTLMQQLGHPHYGGIAVYSRQVRLAAGVERVALRFDTLHESAEIRVNGVSAGVLWQAPHLLEIEPSLWRPGANALEIRCSTSPANYLQAMMRPSGFRGRVALCR